MQDAVRGAVAWYTFVIFNSGAFGMVIRRDMMSAADVADNGVLGAGAPIDCVSTAMATRTVTNHRE